MTYGDVVFVPAGFEIGSALASVGDRVGDDPILELRTADRVVRFNVGLGDLGSLPVGTVVQVRLPSRESFDAEVLLLAQAGGGQWAATARPVDPLALDDADAIPVDVSWNEIIAEQATVVSAGAVRRLDSGRYAIEVVGTSDLDTEFMFVDVGAMSGRDVQLLSGPPAGTTVIVP